MWERHFHCLVIEDSLFWNSTWRSVICEHSQTVKENYAFAQ